MFEMERDPAIVELDRFVPCAPAVVWRALTEPEVVEQWLVRSVGLRPEEGTTFILEIPSDPPGEVSCEVTAALAGERFTHSYTDLRAARPARWIVDWRLVPEGKGTRAGWWLGDHHSVRPEHGRRREVQANP